MRACFGSFEKPHGKILRNHSISLRDRSDSEIEGGWRNTPKTITIRGICHNAGAHMDEVHTAMVFDRVAVKPDELGGSETTGSLFWMGSNPWLKVNLNGERFTNEAAPYDYILNSTLTQPGHTVVDIWDSDYEKYLEQFDIHGCARVFPFDNGAPTNMTLEAVKGINEGPDSGWLYRGGRYH